LLCICAGAALVGAPAALAASAPSSTTGGTSAVTATSATLAGTVNPQGQATSYYFEYGVDTSYGAQTATGDAGSGTNNVSVSALIGSLQPGTTYHYRLVATNASGPTLGADKTFTTVAARSPTVTTSAAKNVAATSATLTGTVNPEGQATTYRFEIGPTTAYGTQTSPTSAGNGTANVAASTSVGSLQPGTTYHYRLVATNASGPTFGADKTLTTASAVPGAPGVTTSAAKSITATAATVTGSVTPKGAATSFHFQYGTTTAYGGQTATGNAGAGTKAVSVSAAVGSLQPSTKYHYRLVATNASGTTLGADKTFTTAGQTRVSLAASPGTVVFGQTTTLAGTVRPPGPVRTTITLQTSPSAFGPYRTVATTTSTSKGAFSFVQAPGSNAYFRVVANRVASAPVRVAVRFRVTLFVSTTHPRRGGLVRLHGSVAPMANGRRVQLQRLGSDHRWHTVWRPPLRRALGNRSTYSRVFRIRRSGLWRAMVRPDAQHARGFSRAIALGVL
jgi:phosphodiesterase/alkaline phosphatase D-like protein